MGKHIDSVVVDTEHTAREAIQYLKDQRVPPMTFIPLASCKASPWAPAHTHTTTHCTSRAVLRRRIARA